MLHDTEKINANESTFALTLNKPEQTQSQFY